MNFYEIICLVNSIFLIIFEIYFWIFFFRDKKRKEKARFDEQLLYRIVRKVETCGKNLSISDKCEIIAAAYDYFRDYKIELRENFSMILDIFIGSRVEGIEARL